MKVSVKDSGVCRKTISIEIPADTLGEERAETLKVYAKHSSIPGFRKGKAPKHVVAKNILTKSIKTLRNEWFPNFTMKRCRSPTSRSLP